MTCSPPIAAPALDRAPFMQALRCAGFTFDTVKSQLGTRYRQWPPQGEGPIDELRCFVERASMSTDIGRAALSSARVDLVGAAAECLRNRRPHDILDTLMQLFRFNSCSG